MNNLLDMYVRGKSHDRTPPVPSVPPVPAPTQDEFTLEPGVHPSGDGFLPPTDLPDIPSDSLQEVRRYVFGNLKYGVCCPACGQHAQVRARSITKKMAEWLCLLVAKATRSPGKFFHVNEVSSQGGGDYAKLIKWGLLETMPNNDPAKRTSGMFRPTRLGINFARGFAEVPSHVFVFNNKVWGKKLSKIRVSDVKRFNWASFKAAVSGW